MNHEDKCEFDMADADTDSSTPEKFIRIPRKPETIVVKEVVV